MLKQVSKRIVNSQFVFDNIHLCNHVNIWKSFVDQQIRQNELRLLTDKQLDDFRFDIALDFDIVQIDTHDFHIVYQKNHLYNYEKANTLEHRCYALASTYLQLKWLPLTKHFPLFRQRFWHRLISHWLPVYGNEQLEQKDNYRNGDSRFLTYEQIVELTFSSIINRPLLKQKKFICSRSRQIQISLCRS